MQDTKENTKTTNEDNEVSKEIQLITTDFKNLSRLEMELKEVKI